MATRKEYDGYDAATSIKSNDLIKYKDGTSGKVYKITEANLSAQVQDDFMASDYKSTDGTMADNSDDLIPSQKAVKMYVDNKTPTVINGITSTAETVVLEPYPIKASTVNQLEISVLGTSVDGTIFICGKRQVLIVHAISDVTFILDQKIIGVDIDSGDDLSFTISVDGNNLIVIVTSVADGVVYWSATIEKNEVVYE